MTNIITVMNSVRQFALRTSPIVGAITNPIIKARRFILIFIMTAFVVFFIASSYAADGDGGVDIDTDNDNFTDAVDVDDDGDGLIEIATVAQLNQVRHNLLGSSLKASAGDEGDITGCGGQDGITKCNGYELVANISLADYANWQPIGSCSNYDASSRRCENRAALFNAIFDGNGYTIRNLNIANPTGDYANGAGLFGAISPASILRNIHIRSANINSSGKNVGLLVGYAWEANIANSSAAGEVSGTNRVGGLVGNGYAAKITSSYAAFGSVSGSYSVGGLVGYGGDAKITSSYAAVGSVSGRGNNVGGLVGDGRDAEITSSYAAVGNISGRGDNVGGLVGDGGYGTISSSYTMVGFVDGSYNVGGLVGSGGYATISSSYAAYDDVGGDEYVGGLVGRGNDATAVSFSYWDSEISGMTTGSYGKPKTTSELQSITSFEGIYASWVENKCADDSQAWNLGTNFQYPTLTCTPGELATQRTYATAHHSYAVAGLQVIPGEGKATLIWNNPYAQIASISISYQMTGSDGVQYLPLIKDSAKTSANAIDAQQIISGLTNGKSYTFTVDLTLRGIYVGKEGIAPSITATIGLDYDGDNIPDSIDPDDDNDGIEDNADACNEAGAAINWISNKSTDFDGDGCRNSDEDVDDNGNGLIEIHNAWELDQVREDLNGRSFAGDSAGCGGLNDITTCNGYELAANISLADYTNWQSIGSCSNYDVSSRRCENSGVLFNATFDGNGYTISNLTITNPTGDYAKAVGLFGAISPTSVLRNIHIRSANISGGGNNVGLLVGYAREASIMNSSAAGEVTAHGDNIGGLVGSGEYMTITSSYATGSYVSGGSNVGGLVGYGWRATIISSYILGGDIMGADNVGGLVGNGAIAHITYSYAAGGDVSGQIRIGGLVGSGGYATISSSYASGGSVSGDINVGGLVGAGWYAAITSSYAAYDDVGGDEYVGGLVGRGNDATAVSFSYWDSEISGMTTGSYGKPKTTSELQSITSFEGIYASWVENKCADDSQAWNLGNIFQYPALTCTPGELTDQRSNAVTGLRVIPGDGKATLIWNNPYAQIESISISYKKTGSDDAPITESSKRITADAKNVQETIKELTNGESYTFTVSLILRGVHAGKEGTAPSVTAAIGPNYDGDDLVNFVDHDDDNDGIEDNADACNEAGAAINWISNKSTDFDGDGCRNSDEDVDDDGNGLIEIHNAWELDQVREDLTGRSFAGNSTGCGGQNTGITACNGYELAANISLADYANWQSIGSCSNYDVSSRRCENSGVLFNATFDGNGYTISNLTITNPTGDYAKAVGLFGAISPTSVLRNIHIRSANISGGWNNVGLLVGYAREASIMNSSAAGEVTAHGDNIGGLVGSGEYMTITSSYATGGYVSGGSNVGGLVGYGWRATIISSYILGGDIMGADNVGGLVGNGAIAHITYSYAAGGDVSGQIRIGGLVGSGGYATISSSYASGGSVSGDINVGGLVGAGWYAAITSSYAAYDDVGGDEYVGGLVGRGNDATAVSFSYWDSEISGMTTGSYGKPKTTGELQSITSFEGIYASWVEDKCADDSQAWNLGNIFQYPALTCTPGELTDQRSYATAQRTYAVTGLRVIPGDGNATLSWNNPYAQIASISISYQRIGSDGVQYLPLIKDSAKTSANAIDAQQIISGLTNGKSYTFTVDLTLRGVHAGKEGVAPSITAAIGPNYDGDDLVNFVDHDDDNDGIEDNADACNEAGAAINWISNKSTDFDGDGCRNSDEDVDDNGNGLIEIHNAWELDQVREDLNGRSFAGDSAGCGGLNGITECNGYELVADISLATYTDWDPIGDLANRFTGSFDGNGYTISDLTITNSNDNYDNAVGLFGAISSASILRKVHIRSANITGAGANVGILVGYAQRANIRNSSVSGEVTASDNNVGGLVGNGFGTTIMSSYAVGGAVNGKNFVGGLVGYGRSASITSSYAAGGSVRGQGSNVGGLVGDGASSVIRSSYAAGSSVRGVGGTSVGGLAGSGWGANITSSYAAGGAVSGNAYVGGLVGYGKEVSITSSYAAGGAVSANPFSVNLYIGGLVGGGEDATITNSYWGSTISRITEGSYGFPKTTEKLQTPTSATGIYASWTSLCPGTNNPVWHFGDSSQYPALTCTPGGAAIQFDTDADGDGTLDIFDTFPLNPNESTDTDGDRVGDNADVDDDGDGLIEIVTAAQLNQVRHNLRGSNLKTSAGAAGNALGCGGLNGIITCNGYELAADISLAGYANWNPIGSCPSIPSYSCTNTNALFNSIFDGNDYIISDLTITNPVFPYTNAAGLFGAISPGTQLRNVHIRSASITGAGSRVGILVGYARGARITSSSALYDSVSGRSYVGGLVGLGGEAIITLSYASGDSVRGTGNHVGGLVGAGGNAVITSSYAVSRAVSGADNVGGLVGWGGSVTIRSSYATGGSVRGSAYVGGLLGYGAGAIISDSYWDIYTNGIETGSYGFPRTTRELQTPTSATGIYAGWTATCSDGSRAWNFGTSSQYPALTCAPDFDLDRDGVPDIIDPDADGNGKVDIDTDGDGILDYVDTDDDNDNYFDTLDVDDDGDGLIEIATAEQLNQIRHNLRGSSLKASAGDQGSNTGCGNGRDIKACNGYELTADISLAGYENWEPIGSCSAYSYITCTPVSALFNTIFDGNDYTISDLTITNPAAPYTNGAGLFGAISSASILRNIHIRSAYISGSELNVGLLVGYARGANITNSSASGDITARSANVGGLVGNGHGATITSSYAYVGSVSGNNNIGGLVGWGRDATINSSYAAGGSVSGRSSAVGGLVGYGLSSSIISSYAADGSVSGSSSVGGLVGYGVRATITSSYSAGGSVRGTSSNVGGLVGRGNYATNIIDSYWDSDTSGITTGSYGLPKTTSELQLPTNTNPGIYANWYDRCDDGSDAWDFGTWRQYPALTCTPGGVDAQRP